MKFGGDAWTSVHSPPFPIPNFRVHSQAPPILELEFLFHQIKLPVVNLLLSVLFASARTRVLCDYVESGK